MHHINAVVVNEPLARTVAPCICLQELFVMLPVIYVSWIKLNIWSLYFGKSFKHYFTFNVSVFVLYILLLKEQAKKGLIEPFWLNRIITQQCQIRRR